MKFGSSLRMSEIIFVDGVLGVSFVPQKDFSLCHISAGCDERTFAVHHSRVGLILKGFDEAGRNLYHDWFCGFKFEGCGVGFVESWLVEGDFPSGIAVGIFDVEVAAFEYLFSADVQFHHDFFNHSAEQDGGASPIPIFLDEFVERFHNFCLWQLVLDFLWRDGCYAGFHQNFLVRDR